MYTSGLNSVIYKKKVIVVNVSCTCYQKSSHIIEYLNQFIIKHFWVFYIYLFIDNVCLTRGIVIQNCYEVLYKYYTQVTQDGSNSWSLEVYGPVKFEFSRFTCTGKKFRLIFANFVTLKPCWQYANITFF